jgi:hypothetical protein
MLDLQGQNIKGGRLTEILRTTLRKLLRTGLKEKGGRFPEKKKKISKKISNLQLIP